MATARAGSKVDLGRLLFDHLPRPAFDVPLNRSSLLDFSLAKLPEPSRRHPAKTRAMSTGCLNRGDLSLIGMQNCIGQRAAQAAFRRPSYRQTMRQMITRKKKIAIAALAFARSLA